MHFSPVCRAVGYDVEWCFARGGSRPVFIMNFFKISGLRSIFLLAVIGLLAGGVSAQKTRKKRAKAPQKTVVTASVIAAPAAASTDRKPAKSPLGAANNQFRIALDYNNDLRADYVVFNPVNNNWQILTSGGGVISTPFGVRGQDYFTPGDYDGDGIGDLAIFRDSEHKWYVRPSSTGVVVITDFGATGDEPVARDYDGDGKTDLAVVNRTATVMTWSYKKSTDGTTVSTNWGVPADGTAPGDYDGDGKADLCVRRAGATSTSTGTFIIKKSMDGAQLNIDWGLSSDLSIPGDYDGDNKTDAAVLREGKLQTDPLTWIIKRSSDGTAVTMTFGTTGVDYNAQNDYDGDNITDLAVWNNTTATFTVMRSTGGTVTQALGATNQYPVASYDTH